jgi:hypothetical protein
MSNKNSGDAPRRKVQADDRAAFLAAKADAIQALAKTVARDAVEIESALAAHPVGALLGAMTAAEQRHLSECLEAVERLKSALAEPSNIVQFPR